MLGDDLYTKWSDDQHEISESKWRVIEYFTDNYLKTEDEIEKQINRIGTRKTLNDKADELYNIIKKIDTYPKDIEKFIINLQSDFPINIKSNNIVDIIEFEADNPSPQQWVPFLTTKFQEMLGKYQKFERVFSTIFALGNKKLNNLNAFNKVADKFEKFTDAVASKLPTFDNSNNSSISQNVISNLDSLTDNYDISQYKNEVLVLTDEEQIEDNNDDKDS
jgi:hypothetical protein